MVAWLAPTLFLSKKMIFHLLYFIKTIKFDNFKLVLSGDQEEDILRRNTLRLSCSYFWTRFWPVFNLDPPWIMFRMLLVISSLRFPDQFASSMNIFQNTNFKISNLRLAVLIKVVLIKKVYSKSIFAKTSPPSFPSQLFSIHVIWNSNFELVLFKFIQHSNTNNIRF